MSKLSGSMTNLHHGSLGKGAWKLLLLLLIAMLALSLVAISTARLGNAQAVNWTTRTPPNLAMAHA